MAYWILHSPRKRGRNATYKCSYCGKLCSSYYNDVGKWKCCPHCATSITQTQTELTKLKHSSLCGTETYFIKGDN